MEESTPSRTRERPFAQRTVSEKIADALATIAGFDANLALAYQSEGDLLNLKDKTQNAKAIAQRVKVNCKTSLYYMAKDADTAEVMATESGTIQKAVTFSQGVEIGRHLEEIWENKRAVRQAEEHLVTENEAMMLPAQVGILYRPNRLATRLMTSWVDVDLQKYRPIPPQPPIKAEMASGEFEKPVETKAGRVDLSEGLEVKSGRRRKHAPRAPHTSAINIDDFDPAGRDQ